MKILVTGGAGFIGSNVVDAYIKEGHEVVVIDDLSTGQSENVNPEARFYQMDIRSSEASSLVRAEGFQVINHHAAQMSVPVSVEDPVLDAEVNVVGLLNILEAARRSGVSKVILASTGGAIYGEASEYPTGEDYVPTPLSPYAITKYASENYLAYYSHQYGLNYTVLRYANVYGPRQIPHGEAAVVAIFMGNITSGKESTLYHFEGEVDGMSRDYTFVGDIVKANLLSLSAGGGEILNIGTGVATTTGQLYRTILEAATVLSPDTSPGLSTPKLGPARPGDIKRSCLKVEKASSKINFEATMELKDGIGETLRWYTQREKKPV